MKAPAFQFYPKDFLVDTTLLSNEEVGAYVRLMCYAWVGLPGCEQCSLPDDQEKLGSLAQIPKGRIARVFAAVLGLFRKDPATGAIYHPRLRAELRHQEERSDKAKVGARVRWDSDRTASAMRPQCEGNARVAMRTQCPAVASATASASPSPLPPLPPSPAKPTRVVKPDPESDPDFLAFWAAYPRKAAKKDAEKAWLQTAGKRPNLAALLAAVADQSRSSQWTRDNGDAIPFPATWLRGERWGDSLAPARGMPAAPPASPADTLRRARIDRAAEALRPLLDSGSLSVDAFDDAVGSAGRLAASEAEVDAIIRAARVLAAGNGSAEVTS